MTAPAVDSGLLTRSTRLLFHWEASRFSVNALDERVGTFSRNATAAPLDVNGTARTVRREQPAWQIVDWDGDATRDRPALLLGSSDRLFWSHGAIAQALTLYVEFVENGSLAIASAGIGYLGNVGNTGARFWIDSTGTQYRVRHHNGTTEVTSTMTGTAPSNGQRVRLRATLSATGVVQLHQSINGAAETSSTASGTNTLPTTAFGDRCQLGSTGSTNPGNALFVRARLASGVRTEAQMQEAW